MTLFSITYSFMVHSYHFQYLDVNYKLISEKETWIYFPLLLWMMHLWDCQIFVKVQFRVIVALHSMMQMRCKKYLIFTMEMILYQDISENEYYEERVNITYLNFQTWFWVPHIGLWPLSTRRWQNFHWTIPRGKWIARENNVNFIKVYVIIRLEVDIIFDILLF